MSTWLRNNARRIVAILIVAVLYVFTLQPRLSMSERQQLTAQFRFAEHDLAELMSTEQRHVRDVHPDIAHIASWISSVGAACSLSDMDGDGLPNDVCYIDTRIDRVIVAPVPGTASRFAPFTLDAAPLPYDPRTMAPTGCVPGDLNEDGLLDILVYYWGRTPVAFLHRATDEHPSLGSDNYVRCELSESGERWFTNAATRADVDGDGHVDIVIGNYFQDGANILDINATDTQHMHHAMSRATNGGRNRLLLWSGGTSGESPSIQYTDAGDVWGEKVCRAWTLGIGAADLDGDLLPELYFANDFGHDRLLHNRSTPGKPRFALLHGKKQFTTPNSKVLGRDSFKGMGVDFGDINGDGHFDIYVSNIAEVFALEESHFAFVSTGNPESMRQGVAPYVEKSESLGLARSGWGWESRLADFNNDGVLEAIQATGFVKGDRNRWPHLHEAAMGNDLFLRFAHCWHRILPGDDLSGHAPNPFFVRGSDGRFYDLAAELGLNKPQVTRGIATADVDGDGDLDFVVGNQWDSSRFYRNDGAQATSFIILRLLLPTVDTANDETQIHEGFAPIQGAVRPAIGAIARLIHPDGRTLIGQVDGGNGHSGTRSPEIHFGLGTIQPDEEIDVSVRWRDTLGSVHEQKLRLNPGWHSVVLGGSSSDQTSKELASLSTNHSRSHLLHQHALSHHQP